MEDQPTSSPVIKKEDSIPAPEVYTFAQCIPFLLEGKKITKLEWANNNIFGMIVGDDLRLHKEDDVYYQWILNTGDLEGEDFIVLSEAN